MNLERTNLREEIIEYLIVTQPFLKAHLNELREARDILVQREWPTFRQDIRDQCEARIKQYIAFHVSDALAVPAEYVIIELERIDIEEYIDV